jgi:acyl-CoA reductase-like NAD-dependent aldehyde dehydrogenase
VSRSGVNRALSSGVKFTVDNPYTEQVALERAYATDTEAFKIMEQSHDAHEAWKKSPMSQRKELVKAFIEYAQTPEFVKQTSESITELMGKPLGQATGEMKTMVARAKTLFDIADEALATKTFPDVDEGKTILSRRIEREPVGPVLVLSPWNYPYLCAINVIVPAILAGDSIVLKHAERTATCSEFFEKAFKDIGAPAHLVQAIHAPHDLVAKLVKHPRTSYVAFTGSVNGGRAVYKSVASAPGFIDVGLELGGKDAAYVTANADVATAVDGVVDGAMYNAGQSCCAVERVYVHESVYDEFVDAAIKMVKGYKLGNPLDKATGMGPIAQPIHGGYLEKQVAQAQHIGGIVEVGGKQVKDASGKGRFFAPTVIRECTHQMSLMVEESFGPILAIAKPVRSDEEAIKLINDSPYGLTASVWTKDGDHANKIAAELDVGTVFQNRCDFVDPLLPWAGRHDSGSGGPSCSYLGYLPLTRSKGYNFRRPKQ